MLWSVVPSLRGRSRSRLIAVSDAAVSNRAFFSGTDVYVHRDKREGKQPLGSGFLVLLGGWE